MRWLYHALSHLLLMWLQYDELMIRIVLRDIYCLHIVNLCISTIGMYVWLFSLLQIAFTFMVYPSLILAYMGQAAYLSQHHVIENESYRIGFYVSVPGIYIPSCFYGEKNIMLVRTFSWWRSSQICFCCFRETKVACSGDCYTCCCGREPSHHHWNLFNY